MTSAIPIVDASTALPKDLQLYRLLAIVPIWLYPVQHTEFVKYNIRLGILGIFTIQVYDATFHVTTATYTSYT